VHVSRSRELKASKTTSLKVTGVPPKAARRFGSSDSPPPAEGRLGCQCWRPAPVRLRLTRSMRSSSIGPTKKAPDMIKGRVVPIRAAIKRPAKELDFDVRHLESKPIDRHGPGSLIRIPSYLPLPTPCVAGRISVMVPRSNWCVWRPKTLGYRSPPT
jgi:hypothetical protein